MCVSLGAGVKAIRLWLWRQLCTCFVDHGSAASCLYRHHHPPSMPQSSAHAQICSSGLWTTLGPGRDSRKQVWRKPMTDEQDDMRNLQMLPHPTPRGRVGNCFPSQGRQHHGRDRAHPSHQFFLPLTLLLERVSLFFLRWDNSQVVYCSKLCPRGVHLAGPGLSTPENSLLLAWA